MNSLCFQFELHCLGPVTHGQKGSVVHWTREDGLRYLLMVVHMYVAQSLTPD